MSAERKERLAQHNFFEELMALRDEQREVRKNAPFVVKGSEIPLENNRHGLMQWYLHPNIKDLPFNTMIVYVQHIPPGGKSGRQAHPGGKVFYVWKGKGHTVIDGVSYQWEEGEVIQLPIRLDGVVYQHFNDSDEEPAKLIACQANLTDSLGVEKHAVFEQLENSPDYNN